MFMERNQVRMNKMKTLLLAFTLTIMATVAQSSIVQSLVYYKGELITKSPITPRPTLICDQVFALHMNVLKSKVGELIIKEVPMDPLTGLRRIIATPKHKPEITYLVLCQDTKGEML